MSMGCQEECATGGARFEFLPAWYQSGVERVREGQGWGGGAGTADLGARLAAGGRKADFTLPYGQVCAGGGRDPCAAVSGGLPGSPGSTAEIRSRGPEHCAGGVSLLERPLVFLPDFLLLIGREVVLDMEILADLLGGLALDDVRDGLAAEVEEALDVQEVGSKDQLVQDGLVHVDIVLVPLGGLVL